MQEGTPARRPRSSASSPAGSTTVAARPGSLLAASAPEARPGVWLGTHVRPLDGLRGAAVLGVLAFHDRRLQGGWLGVDLFFTLSGFLITSLLVAELDRSGTVHLGAFWKRRARRLLPPLIALVAVLVIWDRFGPAPPWASSDLRGAATASLAYVGNWYQAFAGGGYWGHFGATPSPLRHTWSLAIEEQFYVLFPLVVWACCRWSRRPVQLLLVLCTTGWALSFLETLALSDGSPDRVYLGTDTRVGSILIGSALACVLALSRPGSAARSTDDGGSPSSADDRRSHVGRVAARDAAREAAWARWAPIAADAAGLASVVVLALLWWRIDGEGGFGLHGGLSAHALLVAVVVAVVVRRPGSLTGRLFSLRPLTALGTISYGLYLWHWPVFLYVDQRVRLDPLPATAVKLAGSFGLALVSYALLERPVRLRGVRALGGPLPALGLSALVVIGVLAVPPVHQPDLLATAPTAVDDLRPLPSLSRRPLASGATVTLAPRTRTTELPPPTDGPTFEAPGVPVSGSVLDRPGRVAGPPRLLVVGDSVPFLLGEALARAQDEFGLVVANRALVACSAARPEAERANGDGLPEPGDCAARWTRDAREFDPDVVVLSLNGDVGVELKIHGSWGGPCSANYRENLTERLDTGLAAFTKRGGRVFVLTPLPTESPVMRSRASIEGTQCLGQLERDVARRTPGVSVVAFGAWVCPGEQLLCRAVLAGRHVRRTDGVHFVDDDAVHVWRQVLPGILEGSGVTP